MGRTGAGVREARDAVLEVSQRTHMSFIISSGHLVSRIKVLAQPGRMMSRSMHRLLNHQGGQLLLRQEREEARARAAGEPESFCQEWKVCRGQHLPRNAGAVGVRLSTNDDFKPLQQ